MRINDVKVHREDARTLVDLLLREGSDDALAAATAIETGLAGRADVDLSNAGLRAVWIVLADYPPERVAKVCGIPVYHLVHAARIIERSRSLLTFWPMGASTLAGT